MSFSRIPGTESRLIVIVDEAKVAAEINREIRTAYLQLGLVCLFVLLGALVAAEKLIIQPIEMMAAIATAFRPGRLVGARGAQPACRPNSCRWPAPSTRWRRSLAERERELIATNDRLTVMASIDMLSGLANRRGFQSRLDFEWMKAQQYGSELSLLMIDVDHFKLFNDTYGHPEGDACLTRLGETLAGIAADDLGFAGRYGGEEFCLLLPNTDIAPRAGGRREGAPGGPAPGDAPRAPAAIRPSPSASAWPAAKPNDSAATGRSDRSRRRRALCRQASRPQRGGRARPCADHETARWRWRAERWRASLPKLIKLDAAGPATAQPVDPESRFCGLVRRLLTRPRDPRKSPAIP